MPWNVLSIAAILRFLLASEKHDACQPAANGAAPLPSPAAPGHAGHRRRIGSCCRRPRRQLLPVEAAFATRLRHRWRRICRHFFGSGSQVAPAAADDHRVAHPKALMNIHNIANQGSLDQTRDRTTERAGHEKTVIIPAGARDRAIQDEATISSSSRDTLAAVEGFAERARGHGEVRSDKIAAAAERLQSGELNSAAVIHETARQIVESEFFAG
ncbi:MAG: hypothetical protein KDC98_14075 [Planctomycetes bacterium]|nr:hypothetical protein [Planctomycetota bacterium]